MTTMSQLGNFLDTPITDTIYNKFLADFRRQPVNSAIPRALGGLTLPALQRQIKLFVRAFKKNDWSTASRIGAELIAKGVDWEPSLYARCALSWLFQGQLQTCFEYCLDSLQYTTDQAPAFVALARAKCYVQSYNDALKLLDLAKFAQNLPTAIWQATLDEATWALRIATDRCSIVHHYISQPGMINYVKSLPQYAESIDWQYLEETVRSTNGDLQAWFDADQTQLKIRKFTGEVWFSCRPYISEHLWMPFGEVNVQKQSAFSGFTCSIFQRILQNDVRLTATLGSTCRTFKAWTSRNETWALIAGHGQLPQLNDIMENPETLYRHYSISAVLIKTGCTSMLKLASIEELEQSGRDLIERNSGVPVDVYFTPYCNLIQRAGEWACIDVTTTYTHHLLDTAPNLIPAILKHCADISEPSIHSASVSTLITLAIRGGMRVLREFDRYGLQTMLTSIIFCDGFIELASLHAVAYGCHYLTQYAAIPQPILISPRNLFKSPASRLTRLASKERLNGKYALVMVPFSHMRSLSSKPNARDDIFNFFATGAHLCMQEDIQLPSDVRSTIQSVMSTDSNSGLSSAPLTDIQHAILDLKFNDEAIEGEGIFVGERGKAKLSKGISKLSLPHQVIYMALADQTKSEITILDGGPHAMGFGGIWSTKSASAFKTSNPTAKGTWFVCKLSEMEGVSLPVIPTVPFETSSESDAPSPPPYAATVLTQLSDPQLDGIRRTLVDLQLLARGALQLKFDTIPPQSAAYLYQAIVPITPESRSKMASKIKLPTIRAFDNAEEKKPRLSLYVDACSALFELRKFIASKFILDIKADLPILRRASSSEEEEQELITILSKWNRLLCLQTYEIYGLVTDQHELAQILEEAVSIAGIYRGRDSLLLSSVARPGRPATVNDDEEDDEEVDNAQRLFMARKRGKKRDNSSVSIGLIVAGVAVAAVAITSLAVFAGIQSGKKTKKKEA